jgi:hypothetical protein
MELKIKCTAKEVEAVNVIIARAIDSLENSPNVAQSFGLSAKDITLGHKFRKSLVKALIQSAKP